MSMPHIPEEKFRPNLCEVTIDILKSVALEETALSHILNAEGERRQALVKKFDCCCDDITFWELNDSVRQTEKMLNTIIMKEWLLLRKLETAYEINQNMHCRTGKKDYCYDKKDNCKDNCCDKKDYCYEKKDCAKDCCCDKKDCSKDYSYDKKDYCRDKKDCSCDKKDNHCF